MDDHTAQIEDAAPKVQLDPQTGILLLTRGDHSASLEGGRDLPEIVATILHDAARNRPNTGWETIDFAAELWDAEAHVTLTTFQGVLHNCKWLRGWGGEGWPTKEECREEGERLAREIEERLGVQMERDEHGCGTFNYPWGSVFAGWDPRPMSAFAIWTWRGN